MLHAFDGLSDVGVETRGTRASDTLFRVVEIAVSFALDAEGWNALRMLLHATTCVGSYPQGTRTKQEKPHARDVLNGMRDLVCGDTSLK